VVRKRDEGDERNKLVDMLLAYQLPCALRRRRQILMQKKSSSRSGFFTPRALLALLLCAAAACSVVSGTLLAFFRTDAPARNSHRTFTFAERVAYQRAIEEVYWRHRIWPPERPDSKPPFDGVMSQAQLEKKVEDYLRNAQALEDYWQRPITAEQLQAEMDRMAKHTKQPEVLRELFEALGTDPFIIAECLAKPLLAERMVGDLSSQEKLRPVESARIKALRDTSMVTTLGNAAYTFPKISGGDPPCTGDTWTATSTTNAPTARVDHTAVWTGSEMIVWGGFDVSGYPNIGGRYSPSTDSWTTTSTTNAPSGRYNHTAVWTGSEMVVWGGEDLFGLTNTGGKYNPSVDSWVATSTTTAPPARFLHTAVWSGNEMIVWGGCANDNCTQLSVFGGRYNPQTDSWTSTPITNAPSARYVHTAVWTGGEMIVWGGYDGTNYLNTGGRYNPGTNSWTATSITDAPSARSSHTAVWTGSEMVIWGGGSSSGRVNTGGRYNPSNDSWVATSTTNAPSARSVHTAVWTGSEMIAWGGSAGTGNYFNTGGRYEPGTDSWTATTTANAPSARYLHTAIWSGSEMIVWGGWAGNPNYFNAGGRYCAQSGPPPSPTPTPTPTATPTPTPTPTPCTGRCAPTPRPRPTPAPRP
jgi:N-acetylneuraminic acid mutarotase